MKILWILFVSLSSLRTICTYESFEVRFQSSGNWSPDEWVEFDSPIPQLKEFTSCHWEKLSYISTSSSHIWSYCRVPPKDKHELNCILLYSKGDPASAYRTVIYSLWIVGIGNKTFDIQIPVSPFQHRTWNHICLVYSSVTNTTTLYYNGKSSGTKNYPSLPTIPDSNTVHQHAFIMGQDMDGLRTGYTEGQAFFGSIAEFNLWDAPFEKLEIKDMANRKSFPKGNVISWEKENFRMKGVKVLGIKNIVDFLKNKKELIIFPKRQLISSANETCSSHGGSIVIPESKMENEDVLRLLLQHRKLCLDEFTITKDREMGIWLGLVNSESNWFKLNEHSNLVPYYYSNWTGSNWKISFPSMCAYMNKDGSWSAQRRDHCQYSQLCTICSLPRTPIFSLKGLCREGSQFQWHYYPIINSSNQIHDYEGYKRFQNISVQGNQWKAEVGGDSISLNKEQDVVGRKEWDWHESDCTRTFSKRNLTFSTCAIDEQFTCNFGGCISIILAPAKKINH